MTNETEKPNRRALAKAATYRKILEAAAGLFGAEGGYEAATIRSIAKAAGMSPGAVFAHFSDKATLYRAIHGHHPVAPEVGRTLLLMLVQQLYGADAMLGLTKGQLIPEEDRQRVLNLAAACANGDA